MPLTDEGYSAPVAADITDEIRADFEGLSKLRPVWERDSVLGPLTAIMGIQLGELYQVAQAIYDARDPNNARGVQLRSLGVATGIPAQDATFSQVPVRFVGDPGTAIPMGTLLEGGGNRGRAQWETTQDVVIGDGGSVDVVARCTTPGAVSAGVGEIATLVSIIFGVDSVTNPDPAVPGEPREDDAEFRARWKASLQRGASSSTAAIRAAVLEVAGVRACVALRNDDAVPTIQEGVAMAPNSVAVIVHPSTLTSAQIDALVRAVFSKVAAGTQMMGSEVRQVTTEAGTVEDVRWAWSTPRTIMISITVEMQKPSPGAPEPPSFADVRESIKDAVVAVGAGLQLGEDVRRLPLLAAANGISGVRSVTSLTLALDPPIVGRHDAAGNIRLHATEIAVIDRANVVVTEAA